MTSGAAWASPTPPGDRDALWAASGRWGPRLPAPVEHLSALRVDSGSCCSRGLGWPPRSASFSPFHCHVTSASGRGVSEPLVPSHLSDGNVSAGKANEPGPHRPTAQPAGASPDAGKGGTPVGRPGGSCRRDMCRDSKSSLFWPRSSTVCSSLGCVRALSFGPCPVDFLKGGWCLNLQCYSARWLTGTSRRAVIVIVWSFE